MVRSIRCLPGIFSRLKFADFGQAAIVPGICPAVIPAFSLFSNFGLTCSTVFVCILIIDQAGVQIRFRSWQQYAGNYYARLLC